MIFSHLRAFWVGFWTRIQSLFYGGQLRGLYSLKSPNTLPLYAISGKPPAIMSRLKENKQWMSIV